MNQILSVDKPKNNSRTNGTGSISSKSVTIFFSIFLIIFGICLIGVSIYSIVNNKSKTISSVQPDSPRIDVTQNATELEIEVTCTSEISKIEYNWEGQETKNINSNGRKNMNIYDDEDEEEKMGQFSNQIPKKDFDWFCIINSLKEDDETDRAIKKQLFLYN